MPLPKGREPLLLGVGIDVRSNDKSNHVKEWHPCLLRKELLREGQRDRGCDPAYSHDGPEAGANSCAHLVPGAGAGDEGHRCKVDGVLDRCDLVFWGQYEAR